jgi:hypothetical protein
MVSFEDFKKALGGRGETMSPEQIQALMQMHEKLAAALFDMWRRALKKKGGEMAD